MGIGLMVVGVVLGLLVMWSLLVIGDRADATMERIEAELEKQEASHKT